jgi:hypothetical protein
MSKLGSHLHNTDFWVVFWGETWGVGLPGVTMNRDTMHCLPNNVKEIFAFYVLTAFLWLVYIMKCSKCGSYLRNTNIWGNFWLKC